MAYRCLILSASMGAGHNGVAEELAQRLTEAGHVATVADLLDVIPVRLGRLLRRFYALMLRFAPWLYDLIFWAFFQPHERRPSVSPLSVIAGVGVRRLIRRYRPDVVVSTFHMAGEVVGRLRRRGDLGVPSVVVITDPAAHELWLAPGTDVFLCLSPAQAAQVTARSGKPALAPGPVVHPDFRKRPDPSAARDRLGLRRGDRAVLISTGSWGVGDVESVIDVLAGSGRYVPVVLCGRNERLRRRLDRRGYGIILGWQDDVASLMAAASALIDNAAGLTCMEAFAAGLPVVAYRPLPGHGRASVRALADAGLVRFAGSPQELLAHLDRLTTAGPDRDAQVDAAAALFASDAAADIIACTARPGAPR